MDVLCVIGLRRLAPSRVWHLNNLTSLLSMHVTGRFLSIRLKRSLVSRVTRYKDKGMKGEKIYAQRETARD
jgi:hypothetical protein